METDESKLPTADKDLVKALRSCAANFCCAWNGLVTDPDGWKTVLDRAADRLEILSDEVCR